MVTTPNRIASNRANAKRSTGPRTAKGKSRSSQNARKHPFNPDPFPYQPINSQKRDAVERIALAQHSMRRLSIFEAGFANNCPVEATQLGQAIAGPAAPDILNPSQPGNGVDLGFKCGLLKLRSQLPTEKYETPNEPNSGPTVAPQPTENTADPAAAQPVTHTPNEPNRKPTPPVTKPRPTLIPQKATRPPPPARKQPV